MTAPNIEAVKASLGEALKGCSLSHPFAGDSSSGHSVAGDSSSGTSRPVPENQLNIEANLELNSDVLLPCPWEQCLDLKTGEVYYINWKTGMKTNEHPNTVSGSFYSEEEDSYEYESSYESSPSSDDFQYEEGDLVVAGCKKCHVYSMQPKSVLECPKCNGEILHFDSPENRRH
ncbi:protein CURLY FLAG LEAF 1-like [Tasmannia lanceolata]|uniref:protein CURLY FLAG LEAF 1-like n=1 Tax=Tasmannia lanceolata TaxID=3420 RepID=UPI004063765F